MTIRVGDRVRIVVQPWVQNGRVGTVVEINEGPLGYEVKVDNFHFAAVPFDRDELVYTSPGGDTSAPRRG